MTPEKIEQERKAFEEWVTTLNNQTQSNNIQKQKDGRYTYDHIEFAWQTWQARAAQSEWISVEDRLPDECNMVLPKKHLKTTSPPSKMNASKRRLTKGVKHNVNPPQQARDMANIPLYTKR